MLAVLAALLAVSSPTPSPVPQKRVEGSGYVVVANDGGAYGISLDAGTLVTSTTADVALFFDPTGNDANACTSTGSSACLTPTGAVAKIPKHVRNLVTVSGAAGNYAGVVLGGFTVEGSADGGSTGILLQGALTNVTPTTGSATGTSTGATAGASPKLTDFGTLTDTGATWTVNDAALLGQFVVITSGAGSGQVRQILSNTATVLTIEGTWTAPTASGYALQKSSVHITAQAPAVLTATGATAAAGAGLIFANNVSLAGGITVKNIDVTAATAISSVAGGQVFLTQVTTSGAASVAALSVKGLTSFTIVDSAFTTTTAAGISCVATGAMAGGIDIRRSLVAAGPFASINIGQGCVAFLQSVTARVPVGSTAGSVALQVNNLGYANAQALRCDCSSVTDSLCIMAATAGATNATSNSGGVVTAQAVDVTNCATALGASGRGQINFLSTGTLSGNALVYGAEGYWGGEVVVPATVTLTAGTHEINLDLTQGPFASFTDNGFKFSCVTSMTTGSKVCR